MTDTLLYRVRDTGNTEFTDAAPAPSGDRESGVVHSGSASASVIAPLPVDPDDAASVHDLFDRFPHGVYSALRTYGKARFLGLPYHLDRTESSMRHLGWATPLDRPLLSRAIDEAARSAPWDESVIRYDVLPEPMDLEGASVTMILAVARRVPIPESLRRDGVRLETTRELRRPSPLVKTSDFVLTRRAAPPSSTDVYEQLLLDDEERILEGSSSTFYTITNNIVQTARDGVLEGITRRILFTILEDLGIGLSLDRLPLADIGGVDGAFLTSSSRGVLPVVRVDDQTIGDGNAHPLALRLQAAYDHYANEHAVAAL